MTKTVVLPSEPYTTLPSADGQYVYVSMWGGASVRVYMASSLTLVGE